MATLQENPPTVSIIILNYETPELIKKLIFSLGVHQQAEIIVIDNSSKDTISYDLPSHIKYFFMNENVGFAGGVNKGIQHAKGEWIMLLNSDTKTSIKAVFHLIDIAKQKKALVAAPKLAYDGVIENSIGYFDSFFKHPVNAIFARPRLIHCQDISNYKDIDIATGGALIIHTSIFKQVGVFDDTNFFMYFEDIDFCYRLKLQSISILYVPEIVIEHQGGKTSNLDKQKKQINYKTSLQKYLLKRRGTVIYWINRIFHALK